MTARIRDLIENLDHSELVKLNRDLSKGGLQLRRLIKSKISEKEKQHNKSCAVCSAGIDPDSTSNYTLVFGPYDFRKKASFCALDCLEYFLVRIKEMRSNAGLGEKLKNGRN